MSELPAKALSVRQPWAWAIIHAGKDIENRSWQAVSRGDMKPKRIAVHAAKGMTRYEYESAVSYMEKIGVTCPPPADLLRGGIIGTIAVLEIVKEHPSPWFMGPRGLVLSAPQHCEFIPSVGALGYFTWKPADPSIVPEPARWMIDESEGSFSVKAPDRLPMLEMMGGQSDD